MHVHVTSILSFVQQLKYKTYGCYLFFLPSNCSHTPTFSIEPVYKENLFFMQKNKQNAMTAFLHCPV